MMECDNSFAQGGAVETQYYQVRVSARLDRAWMEYLPVVDELGFGVKPGETGTSFVLRVIDQAELMGIINSLHGLGLCLLSVRRLPGLLAAGWQRPGGVG